jgi:hypothetical protein
VNRRDFVYLGSLAGLALSAPGVAQAESSSRQPLSGTKLLGMYVHEGWPYNHPYAARTWSVDDWRAYGDGLRRLGFNTIIMWPAIEIMPDPLTESDRKHLEKTGEALNTLRQDLGLRVYITLCPNFVPHNDIAAKYDFESRPLFGSATFLNPADKPAVKAMIDRRQQLLRSMSNLDGLVLIDSDPGGYPGSTNEEFANLLYEHRKMLDRMRPGIELVYWMHVGWEGYSRYLATGQFQWGKPEEAEDLLGRLNKLKMDPWRITIHTYDEPPNGTNLQLAKKMGKAEGSLAFNYGALEAEPSFPLTNYGGEAAFKAGQFAAPGGVVANAQTHCVQLPNTFAFARGGKGESLPAEKDYLGFADQLITGQGESIVQAWKALAGTDPAAMRSAAQRLEKLDAHFLQPGPLKGLLLNDPTRFMTDLVMELKLKAAFEDFVAATEKGAGVKPSLRAFTEAADAYQKRTGYQCVWGWPKLAPALRTLKSPQIDAIVNEDNLMSDSFPKKPGTADHNRYLDGLRQLEVSTPQLIEAMKAALGSV